MDREAIYCALDEILNNGAYSNLAINKIMKKYEVYSPKYVRNVVKGVIKYLMLLDFYIDALSKKGINSIKKKDLILLRMGFYEILMIDGVPDYAVVNEIVTMAKRKCKGRDKFINGMLRGFIRNKDNIKLPENDIDLISVTESFPKELVMMFVEQYGYDKAIKIIKALNKIPVLTLRCNTIKTDRKSLIERMDGLKESEVTEFTVIAEKVDLISSEEFKNGLFSVQGEASVMAVKCLNPKEGSDVLDMCAAPGGKSTLMAMMMNNKGMITACDVHEHRLELINNECKRLSVDIVNTVINDGTVYREEYDESFDYILADVPCSGLGVIAKKPEIKYSFNLNEMEKLPEIQYDILNNAGRYVKKQGEILYSTCTLNVNENEGVVEMFLKNNKDFKLVEKNTTFPYNGTVDGFFYAKLVKTTD